MSFSSLLEEANHTLESDGDLNDSQWSIDSNSSNTLQSPLPMKLEQQFYSNQNCGKQNFVNTSGNASCISNQNFINDQANVSRQFLSYHVKAEPNPLYNQNVYPTSFTNQLYQQPFMQQRTHLPIQFDEMYNINSIPRHQFVLNNNNHAMLNSSFYKPLAEEITSPNPTTDMSRKRANKKAERRKKVKIELKGPPLNWRPLYDNIMEMRKNIVAPVDVMGCFKNAESDKGPKVYRYQVMVSLMLSSQTKDEVTAGAMRRLKTFGLDPKHIAQTEESVLAQLIHPVGFWQKKAGYVKNASRIVHTEYQDEIPKTVEGLTSLPGIGPKMAHLCMEFAWNKLTGISVDTHVHRICQRLGWTPTGIRNPDDTRKLLEHWLPKEEWGRINLMMVGFGQVICLPTKPRCFECKNKDICQYALSNPDRTLQKCNQPVRPSARSMKLPKDECVDGKAEIGAGDVNHAANVIPKTEKTEGAQTCPSPYANPYQTGYQTPLLTPPLQPPPQEFSIPQSVRCPKTDYVQSPTPLIPSHYTSPSYGNMKLDLIQSPEQIYQTLTPSASPHGAPHPASYPFLPRGAGVGSVGVGGVGVGSAGVGGVYPPFVGAYTQNYLPEPYSHSPLIDNTAGSSLINPLNANSKGAGTRLSHESLPSDSKSDNILDNFLDW